MRRITKGLLGILAAVTLLTFAPKAQAFSSSASIICGPGAGAATISYGNSIDSGHMWTAVFTGSSGSKFTADTLPGSSTPYGSSTLKITDSTSGTHSGTVTVTLPGSGGDSYSIVTGEHMYPYSMFDYKTVIISCSIPTSSLRVIKHVVGGTKVAADFMMSGTGPTPFGGAGVEAPGANYPGLKPGSYTVSETSFPGYLKAYSGDCNAAGVVTLSGGDSKSCTVTNTYSPPPPPANITIIKIVINNEPAPDTGTSIPADFLIHVKNGGAEIASAPGSPQPGGPGTTYLAVPAGVYSVSETGAAVAGYTQSFSPSCAGGLIVLAGVAVVCTVTNDDGVVIPPGPRLRNDFTATDGHGRAGYKYVFSQNDLNFDDPSNVRLVAISLTSDNPAIRIIDPDLSPGQSPATTSYLYDFLVTIKDFFTAMIWGDPTPVAFAFSGPGNKSYFIPPAAGTYNFTVTGTYTSGIPNPVIKSFQVVVVDYKSAVPVPAPAPSASITTPQQCSYHYLDFPGLEIFGALDADMKTVRMICLLRPVMSGVIRDGLLGAYLNLYRTHAIIATVRLAEDKAGIYWLFTPGKRYDSHFVDVAVSDEFRITYDRYTKGFSSHDAFIAATVLGIASDLDKKFIIDRFAAGQNNEQFDRYLLPSSPIIKNHLFQIIYNTLGFDAFGIQNQGLAVAADFDTPDYQKILAPLAALGITDDFDHLDKSVKREDALPLFFRLQQFNELLRGEFDGFGFTVDDQGNISQGGQPLTLDEARKLFVDKLKEKYPDFTALKALLEDRVSADIAEYWDAWHGFLNKQNSPFMDIRRIIQSSKDPGVIIQKLRELLGR